MLSLWWKSGTTLAIGKQGCCRVADLTQLALHPYRGTARPNLSERHCDLLMGYTTTHIWRSWPSAMMEGQPSQISHPRPMRRERHTEVLPVAQSVWISSFAGGWVKLR